MTSLDHQDSLTALESLRGYRSSVRVTGDYPEAAVLVPLMVDGDDVSVLLTRRASHLSIHAGESAFPGGKRDAGDPSLLATALREAREEIALDPEAFDWLLTLDQHLTRTEIKVSPFVGFVPADVSLAPNPGEIEEIFTVPLSHFTDCRNLGSVELEYRGGWLRSPCFHYGDHAIWGVTARTLMDLVNRAFDIDLRI